MYWNLVDYQFTVLLELELIRWSSTVMVGLQVPYQSAEGYICCICTLVNKQKLVILIKAYFVGI